MYIACERGQKDVIQQLLEANANVNEKDSNGNTALSIGIFALFTRHLISYDFIHFVF